MAVTIAASSSGGTDSASVQVVPLPGVAGTNKIVLGLHATNVTEDGGAVWAQTAGTTGWTELSDSGGLSVWSKEVTGAEANPSFTCTAIVGPVSYVVYRLAGYSPALTPNTGNGVSTSSTFHVIPQTTVTGSPRAGLYLVFAGLPNGEQENTPIVTKYPTSVQYNTGQVLYGLTAASYGTVTSAQFGTAGDATRLFTWTIGLTGAAIIYSSPYSTSHATVTPTVTVWVRDTTGLASSVGPVDGGALTVTAGDPFVARYQAPGSWGYTFEYQTGAQPAPDVTGDVRGDLPVTIDLGLDTGTTPPGVSGSVAEFTTRNSDHKYHPANTSSELAGRLDPSGRMRIFITRPNENATQIASGVIADVTPNRNPSAQSANVLITGSAMRILESATINIGIQEGLDTHAALRLIEAAARCWGSPPVTIPLPAEPVADE